jgi:pilus assembly protein TadC
MMDRLRKTAINLLVYGWVPFVAVLGFTLVLAQEGTTAEAPGIHLTIGVIAVVVGIVAFIGPGFYLLGRYDHRLSSTEAELMRVADQMERLVERGIGTGDRVALAIEAAVESGVALTCPLAGDCPHPAAKRGR